MRSKTYPHPGCLVDTSVVGEKYQFSHEPWLDQAVIIREGIVELFGQYVENGCLSGSIPFLLSDRDIGAINTATLMKISSVVRACVYNRLD